MFSYFCKALSTACRQNSELTQLLNHSESGTENFKISFERVNAEAQYPILIIETLDDRPGIENSFTAYKQTLVEFNVCAKNLLQATQILDVLEKLQHANDEVQHTQYWNISTDYLKNTWTYFQYRDSPVFDNETNTWTCKLATLFKWYVVSEVEV